MHTETTLLPANLHDIPVSQLVQTYQRNHHPLLLSELYQRYFDRVYNYCLSMAKNPEVAFDLAQDVFLKITEHLDELRNPDLFTAWLFRIARNRFINHVKANSQAQHFASLTTEESEDPEEHEHALERELLFQKMQVVLDQIPEMDRELLLAKYYHKESIHHLEARFGLSESAIKMRLSRARQRMAKMCG
ncbi:MAG: sigma-70 family RNA polymerase sigma factor [Saprospiraceae bacterium]